jgi:hypothetical protein
MSQSFEYISDKSIELKDTTIITESNLGIEERSPLTGNKTHNKRNLGFQKFGFCKKNGENKFFLGPHCK